MSDASTILTPWHRECIERGATLLVIPFDKQPPKWAHYMYRNKDGSFSWVGENPRGSSIFADSWPNGAYADDRPDTSVRGLMPPASPGDVLVVHPPCPTQACELERWCEYSGECEAEQTVLCKLRCTDVGCGSLDDLDEDAMERCGVRRVPATFTPEIEVWDTVGWTKGLRQSHPSFPADGYVWIVHIERSGK
jgi:hypothetical protein